MSLTFTIGVATRPGVRALGPHDAPGSADAAHAWTAATGAAGAAVIDGIGHSAELHDLVDHWAVAAARTAAIRGALAGLATAALMACDPGAGRTPRQAPDAVAVVAQAQPGDRTLICWVGDCRAYGWDGGDLTCYTTDHTVASWLARHGVDQQTADQLGSSGIYVGLSDATPATAHQASIPAGHLAILTSDGVHDQIAPHVLEDLVRAHQDDAQALAVALVAAAQGDIDKQGRPYRDDATCIVLRPTPAT